MTRVYTVRENKADKETITLRVARNCYSIKLLVLYVRVKVKQNHKENISSTLMSLNCIEKTGRESLQQKLEH